MSLVAGLAAQVLALRPGGRVLVAVDGVDCSGKTTFARALAEAVRPHRAVVHASVDDFPRPAAERYRRGRTSPEGCYRDTTDLAGLRRELLEPFRTGTPHRTRTWSLTEDAPELPAQEQAPADAVLVVDGVYLQRPELAGTWDLVVLLEVSPAEVLRRAARRDAALAPDVEGLYRARYLPAFELYRREADPAGRADVVVDNEDPARPVRLS